MVEDEEYEDPPSDDEEEVKGHGGGDIDGEMRLRSM